MRETTVAEPGMTIDTAANMRFTMPLVWSVNLEEEAGTAEVELLCVGKWRHPDAPTLINGRPTLMVTNGLLDEIKTNFDAGVKGKTVPLDFHHKPDPMNTPGWITNLRRGVDSEGRQAIFSKMQITDPEARSQVKTGSLKFISPSLKFGWENPVDGKTYNVLCGAALTNDPYLVGMDPIKPLNFEAGPVEGEAKMGAENDVVKCIAAFVQSGKPAKAFDAGAISDEMVKLTEDTTLTAEARMDKARTVLADYGYYAGPGYGQDYAAPDYGTPEGGESVVAMLKKALDMLSAGQYYDDPGKAKALAALQGAIAALGSTVDNAEKAVNNAIEDRSQLNAIVKQRLEEEAKRLGRDLTQEEVGEIVNGIVAKYMKSGHAGLEAGVNAERLTPADMMKMDEMRERAENPKLPIEMRMDAWDELRRFRAKFGLPTYTHPDTKMESTSPEEHYFGRVGLPAGLFEKMRDLTRINKDLSQPMEKRMDAWNEIQRLSKQYSLGPTFEANGVELAEPTPAQQEKAYNEARAEVRSMHARGIDAYVAYDADGLPYAARVADHEVRNAYGTADPEIARIEKELAKPDLSPADRIRLERRLKELQSRMDYRMEAGKGGVNMAACREATPGSNFESTVDNAMSAAQLAEWKKAMEDAMKEMDPSKRAAKIQDLLRKIPQGGIPLASEGSVQAGCTPASDEEKKKEKEAQMSALFDPRVLLLEAENRVLRTEKVKAQVAAIAQKGKIAQADAVKLEAILMDASGTVELEAGKKERMADIVLSIIENAPGVNLSGDKFASDKGRPGAAAEAELDKRASEVAAIVERRPVK